VNYIWFSIQNLTINETLESWELEHLPQTYWSSRQS